MQDISELEEIITQCIQLEEDTADIYRNFSTFEKEAALKACWDAMVTEEDYHVECWKCLLEHLRSGAISYLFEDPEEVLNELRAIREQMPPLLEESRKPLPPSRAFFIACKAELLMLHRFFIQMFYYLQSVTSSGHHFGDQYETHLKTLIEALNTHGASEELITLGNTVERLWIDNRDLVIQTNTDPLTKILNRKGFFQTMPPMAHLAQREKNNIAILIISIDNFKVINNTYGHRTGDEILKTISATVKKSVRKSDLIARFGSKEFIVFLSKVEKAHVYVLAEMIRSNIEEKVVEGYNMTVSVGYSQSTIGIDADQDVRILIKKAEDALGVAKATGKNKVVGE